MPSYITRVPLPPYLPTSCNLSFLFFFYPNFSWPFLAFHSLYLFMSLISLNFYTNFHFSLLIVYSSSSFSYYSSSASSSSFYLLPSTKHHYPPSLPLFFHPHTLHLSFLLVSSLLRTFLPPILHFGTFEALIFLPSPHYRSLPVRLHH